VIECFVADFHTRIHVSHHRHIKVVWDLDDQKLV